MDLELETHVETRLSEDEQALVTRARKAAKSVSRTFWMRLSGGAEVPMSACAVVYEDPLRIDFKAHEPGVIGQAFIGPQIELASTLFEGDSFTPVFLEKLEKSFADFGTYLQAV